MAIVNNNRNKYTSQRQICGFDQKLALGMQMK